MQKTKQKTNGKPGVLIRELGAVATNFFAVVVAVKKGRFQPAGSLTQMANIHPDKRTENQYTKISEFAPLASWDEMVFVGRDVYSSKCLELQAKPRCRSLCYCMR